MVYSKICRQKWIWRWRLILTLSLNVDALFPASTTVSFLLLDLLVFHLHRFFFPSKCLNFRLSKKQVCQRHVLQLQTSAVYVVFCLELVLSETHTDGLTKTPHLPSSCCNYNLIITATVSFPNATSTFEGEKRIDIVNRTWRLLVLQMSLGKCLKLMWKAVCLIF